MTASVTVFPRLSQVNVRKFVEELSFSYAMLGPIYLCISQKSTLDIETIYARLHTHPLCTKISLDLQKSLNPSVYYTCHHNAGTQIGLLSMLVIAFLAMDAAIIRSLVLMGGGGEEGNS